MTSFTFSPRNRKNPAVNEGYPNDERQNDHDPELQQQLRHPTNTSTDSTNHSPSKRPGFFFRPFLSWRAARGASSDNAPVNETFPLLSIDQKQENEVDHQKKKIQSKRHWALLKQSVSEGHHLVMIPSSSFDPDSPRTSMLKERIRKAMDFELWQCVLAIFVYILIGIVAFSFVFEHWSIEASIYYSLVTFTTIGYGDLTPQTPAGKVFTCFFALSGVAFLGIALGVVGNNLIEAEEKTMSQTKDLAKQRVMSLFSTSSSVLSSSSRQSRTENCTEGLVPEDENDLNGIEINNETEIETEENDMSICRKILLEFFFILLILTLFALLVAADPGIGVGFNVGDALYYSLVTATTIGYGDFAPTTKNGRLVAIIFIPLAVGAMGHFLSIVANAVMDAKQARMRRKIAQKDLSLEDLDAMDANKDGDVCFAEFLEFMLIAMDKVDKQLIDELRTSFNSLDKDGNGTINKHDLIGGARKKLQDPRRKLELHRYKQHLLTKAREGFPRERRRSSFFR